MESTNIMKSQDFLKSKAEHVLVYGDPGTGKSTLVIELLKHGYKLKYFCIDNGIPLKGLSDEHLNNLEIFSLPDTSTFPIGIQTCRKVITGKEFNLCDTHSQVNCSTCTKLGLTFSRVCLGEMAMNEIAVFDHLTNLANSALNTVWDGEAFAASGSVKDDGGGYTIWRQIGWLLTDFLSRQQIASFNTICIAQEAVAIFDDKTKKTAPNCGTDRFSATVGSYFDDVIHCSISNGEHKVGSSSTYKSGVITKSRMDIKIEGLAQASLKDFFIPSEIGKGIKKEKLDVGAVEVRHKELSTSGALGNGGKISTGMADLKALLKK